MKSTQKEEGCGKGGLPLFAAVNSGHGFHSFYHRIFEGEGIVKRYVIKGGPGTGKSSFLRGVAREAAKRGREVTPYRCSSDPDSLDAVVLDGKIVLLDGTAPHATEPELPGARDEIVNLGVFWDGEKLTEHYNEIVSYGALKSAAYRRAYRFLSAAMEVEGINRDLILPFVKTEKLEGAVARLMRSHPRGQGFVIVPGIADSVGMRGRVRLDTYEREAERLFVVDDYFGTGSLWLSALIGEAARRECALRVSYSPLNPDLPDAVFFTESGLCFTVGEHTEREPRGRINMKRFVDSEGFAPRKSEFRANERLIRGLMASAEEALREAGRYHMELERIYGACMDFEAEGRFLREFCEKLFLS